MKVKMIKKWRGHVEGTEPVLTEARAHELILTGYADHIPEPALKRKPGRPRKEESEPKATTPKEVTPGPETPSEPTGREL